MRCCSRWMHSPGRVGSRRRFRSTRQTASPTPNPSRDPRWVPAPNSESFPKPEVNTRPQLRSPSLPPLLSPSPDLRWAPAPNSWVLSQAWGEYPPPTPESFPPIFKSFPRSEVSTRPQLFESFPKSEVSTRTQLWVIPQVWGKYLYPTLESLPGLNEYSYATPGPFLTLKCVSQLNCWVLYVIWSEYQSPTRQSLLVSEVRRHYLKRIRHDLLHVHTCPLQTIVTVEFLNLFSRY